MCSKVIKGSTERGEKFSKTEQTSEVSLLTRTQDKVPTTYLQTLVADVVQDNMIRKVRILCDSGSQRSYITKRCAKELQLEPTGQVTIQQELFGGKKTAPALHTTYKISLKSLTSDYQCEISLLDQDRICSHVPQVKDIQLYKELQKRGIHLTDVADSGTSDPPDIQILIGADVWSTIITSEFYKINENLVAVKTKLGWSLVGFSGDNYLISSSLLVTLLCTKEVPKLWDLEVMGIMDPGMKVKQEERYREVVAFFEDTVKRNSTGRYVVKLPWLDHQPPLENNKEAAERRLQTTTRKLHQLGQFVEYDLVLGDWFKKGIIEMVDHDDDTTTINTFYLPHRAVLKENSTTPVRPVFDASAKGKNRHSLNECLEKGPNLIELIPLTLMNFRLYPIGLSADIEKAFLQIEVDVTDRDMLRFFWWNGDQIKTYRHCRVVFGLSCSPFLLGAVINHSLENAPSHLKHTAERLKKSFYVDNCLTGVETKEELNEFISEAQQLLKTAGFNLGGWVHNSNTGEDVIENVLGLKWYCLTDELGCSVQVLNLTSTLTKRSLLSFAQKIFDPIGFITPVMLIPKILLQKTWSLKLGWDDNLPIEICEEFHKWIGQLSYLADCKISRRIVVNASSSLHIFCDASKDAFASCIFLRTEMNDEIFLSLIMSKSRVAPKKILTIPRLELMAALMAVRLYSLIQRGLECYDFPTYFWSDSTVTLAWITNQGPWSVFIENRVKEIRGNSSPEQWRHVPGNCNPADLLSRGCNSKQLLESRWWEGPSFLLKPQAEWPSDKPKPNREEVDKEKRRTVISAKTTDVESLIMQLVRRFSKFSKIVRIIAWLLRFRPNTSDIRKSPDITSEEYLKAETRLFRCIQTECFSKEGDNVSLKSLNVFIDDDGILRMKSRLINEDEAREYLYPIVLPSKHPMVERMVEEEHLLHKHAGTLTLLTILREKIWIIKGRRTVGSIVKRCIVCKKNQAKALQVPFSPLPEDRTRISATFQITGVDLAGPLFTRSKEKCWIVIFTCAVYRAVHLELIQSLSTGAFIQALRRFIARRGRIFVIYSDNGTNFVGTNSALKQLDWNSIQKDCGTQNIIWKFNPPTASWWGGFWERLIRILKDLLRKNLGHASLNFDELNTLLCECEAVMNNRPLTYVSEEPDELKVLKPSMFLQSLSGNDVSDFDNLEAISLVNRWKYLQNVRECLRRRFKKEYLGFLRSTKKMKIDTVQVGDIVLVGSDDKKRLDWSLARVTELFPGKDNINRLVRVKTPKGSLLRPIQRLFPLEINGDDKKDPLVTFSEDTNIASDVESPPITPLIAPVKTRSGRLVKHREKLNL